MVSQMAHSILVQLSPIDYCSCQPDHRSRVSLKCLACFSPVARSLFSFSYRPFIITLVSLNIAELGLARVSLKCLACFSPVSHTGNATIVFLDTLLDILSISVNSQLTQVWHFSYEFVNFPLSANQKHFSLFQVNLNSLDAHFEDLQSTLSLINFPFQIIGITETRENISLVSNSTIL